MLNFQKLTGTDENIIHIGNNTKVSAECSLEFKAFHNGSGGKNNTVKIGENCNIRALKISIQGTDNTIEIDSNCNLNGAINIGIIGTGRKVKIGKNCTINGMFLNCRDQDIYIGDDCLLSNEIKIRSSDAHKIFDSETKTQINLPHSPVVIGNHVWIGQGVFIGKNASIADGCVVGTRSVVTKKITEPNCIIGGIGKILRTGIYWEK
ncbi:acyltransferase [Pseudomonas sp. GL-R-19]|uniref:acyltransferase n=1 Tax=Pseudomonas sp. GL-R-19 TaxID=2832391 RepID=UPI001CBE56D2|nr:acyltransferase [Pseudomonas sp. GL-R-19]